MRRIIFGILSALTGAAVAQEVDPQNGQVLYQNHCIQCHGADATGTGPMSAILNVDIPDLTQISARNEGHFPLKEVSVQIDGRTRLLAHGGDMPVYGPILDSALQVPLQLKSGQTLMVSQNLADLLAYLETLQAEP
ncbi:MAG: cytochrome c [Pseudomonadota bacterium]